MPIHLLCFSNFVHSFNMKKKKSEFLIVLWIFFSDEKKMVVKKKIAFSEKYCES